MIVIRASSCFVRAKKWRAVGGFHSITSTSTSTHDTVGAERLMVRVRVRVRERGGSVRKKNRSLIFLGSNRDNDQGFLSAQCKSEKKKKKDEG